VLSFIFAVLLSVTVHFIALRLGRTIMDQYTKTGLLRWFNFSKWQRPPSWIFKFEKFHWQTVSGRPRLSIVLNVVKIGHSIVEILRFFRILKIFHNLKNH